MSTAGSLQDAFPVVSSIGDTGVNRRWWLHDALVVGLLVVILGRVLSGAFQEEHFGIQVGPQGSVVIRDLAAHLMFARAFWMEGADYSVASHVHVTDVWAGQSVGRALPFGYSPTMLWLLAPFSLLPAAWGYAVGSLASAAAVWWMTRRERSVFVLGALVLLGPLGLVCFALGQTALLTTAGLMFLCLRQQNATGAAADREQWSWSLLPEVFVLWALTAKPPLALVAGVALLATRRWRTVLLAGAICALTTALLTPWLGTAWVGQYLDLMRNYNRETADAAFAWSLRPDHMGNLRSLFWHAGWLGDAVASRVSSVAWLVALAGICVAGIRGALAPTVAWAVAVLSFLLLCPHVTSTEDLLLVMLVTVVAAARPSMPLGIACTIVLLVLGVTFAAPETVVAVGAVRSIALLVAKVALCWLLLRYQSQTVCNAPIHRGMAGREAWTA